MTLLDPRFREAVSAIDAGHVSALEGLLAANPALGTKDRVAAYLREQEGHAWKR